MPRSAVPLFGLTLMTLLAPQALARAPGRGRVISHGSLILLFWLSTLLIILLTAISNYTKTFLNTQSRTDTCKHTRWTKMLLLQKYAMVSSRIIGNRRS